MKPLSSLDRPLTPEEAAEYLQLPRRTVLDLCKGKKPRLTHAQLTSEEEGICRELAAVKGYPRWKRTSLTGGFLYYLGPYSCVEEVFPHFDGTWSAGKKWRGTLQNFNSLREALAYGERLARVWLTEVRLSGAPPIVSPAGFTVTRVGNDAAVEEKQRREGVLLE